MVDAQSWQALATRVAGLYSLLKVHVFRYGKRFPHSALILLWVQIIQHPNYMLSKITSIFIIALWMHNTAVWGFVFPGMSAIRHQSLVCQGCGSPVDKEEAQNTLGKLSARILFRHNPVFYVIQQISEGPCRKRSGLWTISAGLVESKALHSSYRGYSVQHSLPLLTPPINAKGRFRDTASIVEVKKKILHLLYIFTEGLQITSFHWVHKKTGSGIPEVKKTSITHHSLNLRYPSNCCESVRHFQ